MKHGIAIIYLECRADLNEADFGEMGTMGIIVTKWDLVSFGKWIVFIHIIKFFKYD